MSDFHKLIITILKVKPDNLLPRIIKHSTEIFGGRAFSNKFQVSLKNSGMNNFLLKQYL